MLRPQVIPLEHVRLRRRWTLVQPIHQRDLGNGYELLIHPQSGSWVTFAARDGDIVRELIAAIGVGGIDQLAFPEHHPVVKELLTSGLLLDRGQATWSRQPLRHSDRAASMLILKLVGYCNLACTYCYDYNAARYRKRMDPSVARSAIEQTLLHAGPELTILFHGGEPLLAFDTIREIVPFAKQRAKEAGRRIHFIVQTNGTCFSQEVVDFIFAERISIGLSIDGPSDLNDSQRVDHRGLGTLSQIEDALRTYPELLSRTGVLTTVTKQNVSRLVEVVSYVYGLGIRLWDMTLFQPAGRGFDHDEMFAPATDDIVAAYVGLLDLAESGQFDDMTLRPVLHYIGNVLSYGRNNMCLRNGCGAASNLVSIAVDGAIEACDCIKNPTLSLGSMHDTNVAQALDGEVARAIRSRHVGALSPCRECDWRVLCGGTCLAKAGELSAVDPIECALSMALFPEILRRLSVSDRLSEYAARHS